MTILIGTPYHPNGAYIFDLFLANQKQIQENYPDSELILATSLPDRVSQLEETLKFYGLKGKVISYHTIKPDYAKYKIWDIAAAREAIRVYTLSQTNAHGLLFLDGDMIFDPWVIRILEEQKRNRDAIFSGYRLRDNWLAMSGFGCVLMSRKILESLHFWCIEFKNGDALSEDEILEFDLNRKGVKLRQGIFLSIDHYLSTTEIYHIQPQNIPLINKFFNNRIFRYILVKTSIITHRNVSSRLKVLVRKFIHPKIVK
jgi:hypothetical protein